MLHFAIAKKYRRVAVASSPAGDRSRCSGPSGGFLVVAEESIACWGGARRSRSASLASSICRPLLGLKGSSSLSRLMRRGQLTHAQPVLEQSPCQTIGKPLRFPVITVRSADPRQLWLRVRSEGNAAPFGPVKKRKNPWVRRDSLHADKRHRGLK